MQYELRNVEFVGTPHDNHDGTLLFYINVTAGIVGDGYGFTKVGTTHFTCSESLTGAQIKTLGTTNGQNYVTANYPNT